MGVFAKIFALQFLTMLCGCGGVAWNTTLADTPYVRHAMVASVDVGRTTEKAMVAHWGNPTQKIHEGAQTSFVYRNVKNSEPGYFLQFGNSGAYVVVDFQYGIAVAVRSSDTDGCRGTFPPRPPGPGFDNPSTVHPVNCGITSGARGGITDGGPLDAINRPGVPAETPNSESSGKYEVTAERVF